MSEKSPLSGEMKAFGFWHEVHATLQLFHPSLRTRLVTRQEGVLEGFNKAVLKDNMSIA